MANWFYLRPHQAFANGFTHAEVAEKRRDTTLGPFVIIPKDEAIWLWERGFTPQKWHDCHDREVIIMYQDEVIYKAYDGERYAWLVSKNPIRISKKGEGAGIMVSGVINDIDGFMIFSQEDVNLINQRRAFRGKGPLQYLKDIPSPNGRKRYMSYHFFKYGKAREGYWDSSHMQKQTDELIDCFEYRYPGKVALFLFDWSSGHAKMPETAWIPSNMNMNPGGKSKAEASRPTIRLMEDFPNSPLGFRSGDVQHLRFYLGDAMPGGRSAGPDMAGKVKGLKQLVWERGLWKEGMTMDGKKTLRSGRVVKNQDMSARHALKGCLDIMSEKSELQLAIEERGHMCDFLPKFHCELNPIELVWGRSKKYVRENCKCKFEHMVEMIPKSFLEDNIPVWMIMKYCSRARTYLQIYSAGHGGKEAFEAYRTYKSHRRPNPAEVEERQKLKPWQGKRVAVEGGVIRQPGKRQRIDP